MNGGLSKMVDHYEMRQAMLRAIDVNKTDFTDFCNLCKTDHILSSGEIIDIVTVDKKYKIWHCEDCIAKELQHI